LKSSIWWPAGALFSVLYKEVKKVIFAQNLALFFGEMYVFGGLTKTKRCLDVRNKRCLTREHCIYDFLYYRGASLVASLVLLTWSRGAILFFFLLTVKDAFNICYK